MKAFRTIKEIAKDRKAVLTGLPFQEGRSVEIIVLPAKTQAEEIHARIRGGYQKKGIKPPGPGEIRKVVHELRSGLRQEA
jgi:hypothetical protein